MTFVSITRLRLRSIRFLPRFALHSHRTVAQVRAADGFLGGALLNDRRLALWTTTLWRDAAAMKAYLVGGAHLKAMPRLLDWCDEASVVHWHQDDDRAPDWTEAAERMRHEGRPSKVRYPTPHHADLCFAAPRTTRSVALVPHR